jgi:hypothetical protein
METLIWKEPRDGAYIKHTKTAACGDRFCNDIE